MDAHSLRPWCKSSIWPGSGFLAQFVIIALYSYLCRGRYGFWDGTETLGPRRWLAAEALPDDEEEDEDDPAAGTGGAAALLLVSAMGLTVASIGSH